MAGFLGDKQNLVVHHLANMQKECNIFSIPMNHRQWFTPDSLEIAKQLGFKPCPFCN